MEHDGCPCPKDGCVKTANYLENHSHLSNWDGTVCPHCGNPILKRGSTNCPCMVEFCPCKGMHIEHQRAYQINCPCVKANCDCLNTSWKHSHHSN